MTEKRLRLGFTGTRNGTTAEQRATLRSLLTSLKIGEVHHGACLGADTDFAVLMDDLVHDHTVHAHPSNLSGMTSTHALSLADAIHDPMPPLERNRDIVNASDLLIACPQGKEEELRSGTWATIRYARRMGKQIIIIHPDGTTKEESTL